jgi:SnoaL-like domain
VNFAANFVDHGADVPQGMPPGPAGAIAYVGGALKRFPDLYARIEDSIAEDDRVVVRNHWTATDSQTGKKLEFRGIVIWEDCGAADCGAVGVFGAAAFAGVGSEREKDKICQRDTGGAENGNQ